jgi:phage I-like protein
VDSHLAGRGGLHHLALTTSPAMAPTAAIVAAQSHSQAASMNPARRPAAKHRPVSTRIHNRSQSSTKLASAAGLAFTQAHPEDVTSSEPLKAKRRTKSVEDVRISA